MSDVTAQKELYSVDTNTMPWTEFYIEQLKAGFPMKGLLSDPDTGMSVAKITYFTGWIH